MQLSFEELREANIARLPHFKNRKGGNGSGQDWAIADWFTALTGEFGEAANIVKHIKIGDLTVDEARHSLSKEFADIVIYLDILANKMGIELDKAIILKFNEKSDDIDCDVKLPEDRKFWMIDSKKYGK